jgi:preprotein translocase SecE subunit
MKRIVLFLQESKAELHRVSWPGKEKTARLTGAVLAITLVTALFIAVSDRLFSLLVSWVVGK